MGKKTKRLIIALSVAAILALSIGTMAAAASPNGANGSGICCGQEVCLGGQSLCLDTASQLLGLTKEEIQAQRQEGKSLVQIAAASGVTEQQLVEAIMTAKQAEIQARITAGTLTQEQASLVLQQMEQNTVRAVNRTTIGQPEWAANGNAGNYGQGAGLGQMKKWGQNTNGASYGEPGLGTRSGNMHQFGRASR